MKKRKGNTKQRIQIRNHNLPNLQLPAKTVLKNKEKNKLEKQKKRSKKYKFFMIVKAKKIRRLLNN